MRRRRDWSLVLSLRLGLAASVIALGTGLGTPALAQLLPSGFFDVAPMQGTGGAEIEANSLQYNADTEVITASGGVVLRYRGYVAKGDRLIYNQANGNIRIVGNAEVKDPSGAVYRGDEFDITGGMKAAVLRSLRLTTKDGALITAEHVDFRSELRTIMTNAGYAPCGDCIDEQGRTIGWRVRAAEMVYDNETKMIHLKEPKLDLLGRQVAWLPWLSFPDPSRPEFENFRPPVLDYGEKTGARLVVPWVHHVAKDLDLIYSPTLLSRQGVLLGIEAIKWFERGDYAKIYASGLYQLDPTAFAGTVGDRDWRGAIQTSGRFTPVEDWKVGWSYTAFTDAAYLGDYRINSGVNSVNEVYATHLSEDLFIDLRAQHFQLLGNVTEAQQNRQAIALPNARFEHVTELAEGWGQVSVTARMLGVRRAADDMLVVGGVPYVLGYEEEKGHLQLQGSWQNQWIVPGGLVATPYLGLRADAAYYDGASPLMPMPATLTSATPIAAIDLRYPLMFTGTSDVHIVEPIAQLVYRGNDTSLVGLTNDDAQSFVFEDTNLFSYNRFSGSDRQETGLRANVGARYYANFADGAWLELMAGQSFHLAGVNAFGDIDGAQVGNASGLENTASYMVLGAKGSPFDGLDLGAKLSLDPVDMSVARAGLAATWRYGGFMAGVDYQLVSAEPTRGVLSDRHEISGTVQVPVYDYWKLSSSVGWDLAANSWLDASASLLYDDGYLAYGGGIGATGPTHRLSPNAQTFFVTFRLKGPNGLNLGF